jgi:hypothetical protein
MGRSGIAIVRSGRAIASLITVMNKSAVRPFGSAMPQGTLGQQYQYTMYCLLVHLAEAAFVGSNQVLAVRID